MSYLGDDSNAMPALPSELDEKKQQPMSMTMLLLVGVAAAILVVSSRSGIKRRKR